MGYRLARHLFYLVTNVYKVMARVEIAPYIRQCHFHVLVKLFQTFTIKKYHVWFSHQYTAADGHR